MLSSSPIAPRPAPDEVAPRPFCLRCRRPESACFCSRLPTLTPRTHVVFLQHPRESRVAISTCRMAHLAFAGSELHHGVLFDDNERVCAISAAAASGARTAILFPSPGAQDPTTLPPGSIDTLVVVDGTWPQARKIIERNPMLSSLPRIGLAPSRPSNYRIRREPADNCVSTIEAVVEVLGLLEGDRERFRSALVAFDHMIDFQIARTAEREGPARFKRRRTREPKRFVAPQIGDPARAVAVYAEADASHAPDGTVRPPLLLQVSAVRPATGERLDITLRPRRPLGRLVPTQLEVPAEIFEQGESLDAALRRVHEFLGPEDVLCGWGPFAHELLSTETTLAQRFIDLRPFVSRLLKRRPGGLEQAAALLSLPCSPTGPGRAARRIAALDSILQHLLQG